MRARLICGLARTGLLLLLLLLLLLFCVLQIFFVPWRTETDYSASLDIVASEIPLPRCLPRPHSFKPGQTECKKCPLGRFSAFPGLHECECGHAGYITTDDGKGQLPCPPGTFTAADPATMEPWCRTQYQDRGSLQCATCKAGYFQPLKVWVRGRVFVGKCVRVLRCERARPPGLWSRNVAWTPLV